MLRRRKKTRVEFEVSPATFEALGMGAIAGLRSMAAPALLARAIRRGDVEGLRDTRFSALDSERGSTVLQLLMLGEMIADKTPFVPSRTSFLPLLGRALSGAAVGAALFVSEGRRENLGALLGALAAFAAAHAGERARSVDAGEIPSTILGFLEDGLVLTLGPRLLRRRKS